MTKLEQLQKDQTFHGNMFLRVGDLLERKGTMSFNAGGRELISFRLLSPEGQRRILEVLEYELQYHQKEFDAIDRKLLAIEELLSC